MKRAILMASPSPAVAMMGASHAASADALDDIKKSGKIRIAIDLGVPPYGMTDDKMQPTGSDVETAKAAGQGLGPASSSTCRPPAPPRIPALQTGKADLVISTPVRSRRSAPR